MLIGSFFLLAVTVLDWRLFRIPNALLVAGFAACAAYRGWAEPGRFPEVLVAALAGFLLFLGVKWLGDWWLGRPSLGMGDVKLAGLLAFWLGVGHFLLVVWGASVLGLLYATARRGWRKKTLKAEGKSNKEAQEQLPDPSERIPFGAMLSVASMLLMSFSTEIDMVMNQWLSWLS